MSMYQRTLNFRVPRGLFSAMAFLFLLLTAADHANAQTCSTTAAAWKCWERTLTVTPGPGVDPYRTLKLKVTFSQLGQANLTTYVFWDGGSTYKIRMAFPAVGTWSWSVACEAGCTGTSFSPTSGTVSVATHAGTNPLYANGFLQVGTSGSTANRYLMHSNGTPFFWIGDTSWAGPLRSALSPVDEWADYLNNRKARQFSVIQTALPVDWMRTCGLHPTDAAGQRPFTQISGCSSSNGIPNSCSQWNPIFWRNFERKVQQANDQGFVVAIVGLMERVIEGCNGGQPYPTIADSRIYARNVVARLAGNHVIFSPGFDRKPGIDPDTCTASSTDMSCRMRFVGEEIQSASPRHLVTNHWAGSLDVTAMQPFQDQIWLDFQMFQSGQAKAAANCNTDTQLLLITQRARLLPLTLWDYVPTKPSVNGESIYDGVNGGCLGTTHYNAYRARQTGYLSLLSGATGYTFGVQGVMDWGAFGSSYTAGMTRPSSTQMQYLGNVFRERIAPHQLIPEHGRIKNQAAAEHKKMVVARDAGGTLLLAYLPDNPQIKIRFASLPNVPRDGRWFNPRLNVYTAATGIQDPVDTLLYTYNRPACPAGDSACPSEPDWVLVLESAGG